MTRTRFALVLLAVAAFAPAAPAPKAKPTACFFPYAVGTKWEYIRDGDPKKVYTEEVVEAKEKDGVVTFKVDVTTDTGEKQFAKYTITGGELLVTAKPNAAYDPTLLVRKEVMKACDEWEIKWELKYDGGAITVEETLTVGKAEELTTPAGKFTAMPITRKIHGVNGETVMWYADGVGLIRHTNDSQKEPVQELKSFTPAAAKK